MNVTTYDQHWNENEGQSFREVVIETPQERIVVKEYNGSLEVDWKNSTKGARWTPR